MKNTILIILTISTLIFGCNKQKHIPVRQLRISSLTELSSVDPQKIYNSSDYKIIQAIFEGLIIPEPETMEPFPGVAERWTISPDEKTYEFFLRDTAKWSDGSPVSADDFIYAVQRALSSRFTCSFVELFFPIKNAKDFFYRRIRDFSRVGISAINSRTLRIELEKPTPYFLTMLMHPCWSPLNKDVVSSVAQYQKNTQSRIPQKLEIISNGPFVLSEKLSDSSLVATKSANYWDSDNVLLNSVVFVVNDNQTSVMKKFLERRIEIAELPQDDPTTVGDFSSNGELILSSAFDCLAITFNMENPVFRNPKVRQALSFAVNRENVLKRIGKNKIFAAYNFIPSCNQGTQPEMLFHYDVELAKQLLSEAGFGPNKQQFPPISILTNESETRSKSEIFEQIAEDWKQNLGIEAVVVTADFDSFFVRRKNGNFELGKTTYGGIYPDPALILKMFESKSSKNFGKWSDKKYDNMISEIDHCFDQKDRTFLIKDAGKYLAQAMPVIPLFFESRSYLVKNEIAGWFPNPMNLHPIKFVYFKE